MTVESLAMRTVKLLADQVKQFIKIIQTSIAIAQCEQFFFFSLSSEVIHIVQPHNSHTIQQLARLRGILTTNFKLQICDFSQIFPCSNYKIFFNIYR